MKISILKLSTILLISLTVFVFSCVPARQYEEIQRRRDQCLSENDSLVKENQNLQTRNTELMQNYTAIDNKYKMLQIDTANIYISYRKCNTNYEQLNKSHELLKEQNQLLLEGNSKETKKILADLKETQEMLQKKEDELNAKKKFLDDADSKLKQSQTDLELQKKKLIELQKMLKQKDSVVTALKNKVADALLNFQNKGLTVKKKNGKVYVSMDESLLFESGSYTVAKKGIEALKKLAKVLESNPDISVMIEGHTDNVPYIKGNGQISDNWDLSVMRATSVLRILLEGSKIDPKRIVASGRGQYFPVDAANTKEARTKNRRTEIILTPKLDELLQIIDSN
jgi:chemotaxis protein MotB